MTIEERFWTKVAIAGPNECWLWMGALSSKKYGTIGTGKRPSRTIRAHRLSWEIHHSAKIPDGMYVCHTCDNPRCVNPNHLWLGTHSDNMKDASLKGRLVIPKGARLVAIVHLPWLAGFLVKNAETGTNTTQKTRQEKAREKKGRLGAALSAGKKETKERKRKDGLP